MKRLADLFAALKNSINEPVDISIELANTGVMTENHYLYAYRISSNRVVCAFDLSISTTQTRSAGSPAFRFKMNGDVVTRVSPNAITAKTDATFANTWLVNGDGWYCSPIQWNAGKTFQAWGVVILAA